MFRFTIRDVLWLTVVVAMGVAWLLDRRILASKLDNVVKDSLSMSLELMEERDKARADLNLSLSSQQPQNLGGTDPARNRPTPFDPLPKCSAILASHVALQAPHPPNPAGHPAAAVGLGLVGVGAVAMD